MKRLVLLLALMVATIAGIGCAKPTANPVVVREPVPVPCPPPAIPARPALPSAQLAAQRGPDPTLRDLLRALLADREALAAWALDLEIRLKAYLPPEPLKEPRR